MKSFNHLFNFDAIGDVHGHAVKLIELLESMGYKDSDTGYQHPTRKAIFLGDFIDRGESLCQHRKLLNIVMPMIDNGHALAVMGNHEFNALAFHTMHQGEPLRPHTEKNINQHRAFLNEYDNDPELKDQVLKFFYRLPMWLELDGCRVVHACWDDRHIATLKEKTTNNLLTEDLLIEASTKGTTTYYAVESILKGAEVKLSEGITYWDATGHERGSARVQWWNSSARNLGEIVHPSGMDIGKDAQLPIPDFIPRYNSRKPCFIGHYWMTGEPEPLTDSVACLDYSVAKSGGKLVSYRWDGEQTLKREKFTFKKS